MEKRRYINRHARVRTKEALIRREQVHARMRVAARIDDIRQELNLTVTEFAELLNKAPSEVSDWLSGGHNFTQDTYTLIEVLTGKRIFERVVVSV